MTPNSHASKATGGEKLRPSSQSAFKTEANNHEKVFKTFVDFY